MFESCIDVFFKHVTDILRAFDHTPLFITFCQDQGSEDFENTKKDKILQKAAANFDSLFRSKSGAEQFDHIENTGTVKLIRRVNTPIRDKNYTMNYDKRITQSAKCSIVFRQLALSKSEQQRVSSNDETVNVRQLDFHRRASLEVEASDEIQAVYPIDNSKVLIIMNVAKASKSVVYNLANMNKPHLDMPFGKTVSSSSFDCKTRVLALHSEMDLGVLQLLKFGEDYQSRANLKPIELVKLFAVEKSFPFCLQPNSKFFWFFYEGRLCKFDYKMRSMVKAIKLDEDNVQLKCTPDGSCLLVINKNGTAIPIMTETFNQLDRIKMGQHETKLSKQAGTGAQTRYKMDEATKHESHWINYIYWMYTKFPCKDLLELDQKKLHFWILCRNNANALRQKVQIEVNSLLNKLNLTKKPIDKMEINFGKMGFQFSEIPELETEYVPLGQFLKKLITFIPVQIARCQSNEFFILDNGQTVSLASVNVAFDLIEKINLGYYESIFNSWNGNIKVISSMGKQTTGKSYTLNHLTGSSFNIAGTRCTDGCWMTVKEQDDCLYVIVDFEGLGSFERTEQDDMLLSLFNSSISTITIFKTEKRLDRDVDKMFNKINLGSDQLKGTEKVFKGKFMIVINDVAEQDVEDTPKKFEEKINNISKGEKNFMKKLYNSDFQIMAFPAFESRDYYDNTSTLLSIIKDEIKPVFKVDQNFCIQLSF